MEAGLFCVSGFGIKSTSDIITVSVTIEGDNFSLKSQAWRLIDTGPLQGAHNMAVDEALLCLFKTETTDPILRIYGWNPPALSLGRFQVAENVLDLERCRADSLQFIRRVSGGGAIYHADELTYSIVCSPEHITSTTSVKDSFRVLTGFLIDFYQTLGLNANYAVDTVSDAERLGTRTDFCFAGKETFDILLGHMKIGGNAQRRLKNIIFQHGSIPIINRAHHGLQYMKDRSSEYAENAVSLSDCGVNSDITQLKGMLVEAFKRHMGVDTTNSYLTQDELRIAQELLLKKYVSDQWNLQGDMQ
jgi:lipoate-protein ligase A